MPVSTVDDFTSADQCMVAGQTNGEANSTNNNNNEDLDLAPVTNHLNGQIIQRLRRVMAKKLTTGQMAKRNRRF